jgi:hypothetical protein
MTCRPPLQIAPIHLIRTLPLSSAMGVCCLGNAIPTCPRTATATPALVLPAAVMFAGSTLRDQPSRAARRSTETHKFAGTRSSCKSTMSADVRARYLEQVPSEFPLHVSSAQKPSRRKLESAVNVGVNFLSGPTTRRLPQLR